MTAPHQTAAYLTIADVAERMAVSHDTVRAWISSGALPAVDCSAGRGCKARWRVSPEALDRFLAMRANRTPPTAAPRRRRQPTNVIEFFR